MESEQALSRNEYPYEAFFIQKFEKDLRNTGQKMRLKETEIYRQGLSPPEPLIYNPLSITINYLQLCRGEKLVSMIIFTFLYD